MPPRTVKPKTATTPAPVPVKEMLKKNKKRSKKRTGCCSRS